MAGRSIFAAGRLINIIDCPAFVKLARYFPEAELSVSFDAPPTAFAFSASMIFFSLLLANAEDEKRKRNPNKKIFVGINPELLFITLFMKQLLNQLDFSTGTNDAAKPPRRSNFTSTELDLSITKYCVVNLLSYLPSAINVNLYFIPSGKKSNFIVFVLSLCSALIPPMYHAVPLGRAITTSLPGVISYR